MSISQAVGGVFHVCQLVLLLLEVISQAVGGVFHVCQLVLLLLDVH